ncbi:MAG: phosphoribosyltransferase [Bacillota bacterium]|nr:phosphoribosyltransferase [Bacillota bacterium]
MPFTDRFEAGRRLAEKLSVYRGKDPLILAVPRGGVTVAEPIRKALGGELDLIITRKIGAPHQNELAIGAVTGDGFTMLNDQLISRLGVTSGYLDDAARKEKEEIIRRLKLYRGSRPMPFADNRLVILVDDGVATGYTLLAALRSLQEKKPQKLVLAVPVGPPDTLARLKKEVDELVYLEAPENFAAVGQFYLRFEQVSDQEVVSILNNAWNNN